MANPEAREITERHSAPSGVAAFIPAHSKTPYITPGVDFSSRKGVVRGRRGQQLGFALRRPHLAPAVPFKMNLKASDVTTILSEIRPISATASTHGAL